ncbi:hypothetical protein D9758_003302 [Tetrapyrgos nigripes]|uniref:Ribosomal protein S21 n=1 Tax=Tetrapyrgos nigripes TaxID=182062 RepID=A0A8H5LQ15_9AGAR|nr:hypothetical protein D9758_003302 [Tetrapyrgos nigripes]
MSFVFARRLGGLSTVIDSFRTVPKSFVSHSRLISSSPLPTTFNDAWNIVDKSTNNVRNSVRSNLPSATGSFFTSSNEEIWRQKSVIAQNALAQSNITPYTGRTVKVVDGNVSLALRKLDTILTKNKVRRDVWTQRRHEKKGVKRRRLESERWRRLFAHEVRKNVHLVTKIRNRGA